MADKNIKDLEARLHKLEQAVFGSKSTKKAPIKNVGAQLTGKQINFQLNVRTFVQRYAASKGGPKRFALLVAYLAKGEVGREIKVSDITSTWSKMQTKNLLGKFNRFYSTEAKTKGWVDSKDHGTYCLTPEWEDAL